MKPGLAFISVCVTLIVVSAPLNQHHQDISSKMIEGLNQSIMKQERPVCDHFIVQIGNTENNVIFSEDGTVKVGLGKSGQTFDLTGLQKAYRLNDLNLFFNHR
ncbi:MAG: hypothetical protein ABJA57_04255 [Ginsengibacter sp.]